MRMATSGRTAAGPVDRPAVAPGNAALSCLRPGVHHRDLPDPVPACPERSVTGAIRARDSRGVCLVFPYLALVIKAVGVESRSLLCPADQRVEQQTDPDGNRQDQNDTHAAGSPPKQAEQSSVRIIVPSCVVLRVKSVSLWISAGPSEGYDPPRIACVRHSLLTQQFVERSNKRIVCA